MANPFIHPTRGPLHLGRSAPSPRTKQSMLKAFLMHDFLAQLPPAPEICDRTGGILDWGLMLNDQLGGCTCAALGHLIQSWTAVSGNEVTVPDSVILKAYEEACGYNPKDPNSDQGGTLHQVLDYFRDTGLDGHKIQAHAEVNMTQMRLQQAIY